MKTFKYYLTVFLILIVAIPFGCLYGVWFWQALLNYNYFTAVLLFVVTTIIAFSAVALCDIIKPLK